MNTIHTRDTRNKHQIYNKKAKRAIGKRQLKSQPSQTCNTYPNLIKSSETHSEFKKAFYEWKLEK